MSYTAAVMLAITACLLVGANSDQNLDCRKLLYSRNCRGVAIKRGGLGNSETRSGILQDSLSLKRLIYDLNSATEPSLQDVSSARKDEWPTENELYKDKTLLDHLLYKIFVANKRRNDENYKFPLYEY